MLKNSKQGVRLKHSAIAVMLVAALTGCGQGSNKNTQIPGVTGPNVNFVNGTFTMSVVLQNVSLDGGLRIPVPNMPNSYFEIGPDFQSNGTLIDVGLSTADLQAIIGANILNPTALPGGRPLPGLASGQLPGFAVQVPKFDNVAFYVGTNVFGLFIPVKLGMKGYIATFRFYDGTGTQVGNLSIVGEDTDNKNSGFLLLINIQGKVQQLMQKG